MLVPEMDKGNVLALVVDDHRLVRSGIGRLLMECPEIDSIIEASDGDSALNMARTQRPQLVLMDISLPGMSGVETSLKLLKYDGALRIILLAGLKEFPFSRRLLSSGIKGFMTKDSSVDELREAVAKVICGESFIASAIAQRMALSVINDKDVSPFENLSPRELEIIMMILDGKKNQEMAAQLFISDKTVSTYRTRALAKLDVRSTTELTLLSIRHGLIER